MKVSFYFCLSGMCFLVAFLLLMSGVRRQEEALAARIAPAVLRFHVLANSDSPEDQAIKLQVKDLLLKEIREGAGDAAKNKEELCRYISENRHELETAAENYMAECGVSYSARIRLETCEFPMRTYGDLTFPAGTYDAVRVLLGNCEGKNFWCVLYPSLCYTDSIHAEIPEDSKEQLQALLPEEDFEALLTAGIRPLQNEKENEQSIALPEIKVRFKLLELFSFTNSV